MTMTPVDIITVPLGGFKTFDSLYIIDLSCYIDHLEVYLYITTKKTELLDIKEYDAMMEGYNHRLPFMIDDEVDICFFINLTPILMDNTIKHGKI